MPSPLHLVLVVEDSDEDFEALCRALRVFGAGLSVHRCSTGDEALDYLSGATGTAKLPGLMLLDLNLPGTGGREVLDVVKSDELLRAVPVVILSGASNAISIRNCYRAGAASYIVKPQKYAELQRAVSRFVAYWSGVETVVGMDN